LPGQVSAATFRRELADATHATFGPPRPSAAYAEERAAAQRVPPVWATRRAAPVLSGAAIDQLNPTRSATATPKASGTATTSAAGPQPASTSHRATARPNAPTTTPTAPTTPTTTGQFAAVDIPATVSHFAHRWDYVYLPPAYFTSARTQLGVLILLAGTPSSPAIWASGGGALDTTNAYARAHDGRAPVLLFIDANGSWSGDTECVDSARGRAETYLTRDVVSFATRRLGLSADPARWGIVGFSEGGTCAYDLALRHPDLFHYAVDLAGDAAPNVVGSTLHQLYDGSKVAMREHEPAWLLTHPVGSYRNLTAWFGAGMDDVSHLHLGRHQATAARRAGIHATWFAGPDGHDWQFCTWALQRVLPGLAADVGAPSPPAESASTVALSRTG
jgi:S-formylglutathione hydrolase FrmB